MKSFFWFSRLMLAVILLAGITACDDDDDSTDPVGADIAGTWSGVYYVEGHSKTAIRARVDQDGDAVIIHTDKPTPPGQSLSGSISPSGSLSLIDAADGELWTSLSKTRDNYIHIGDYVRQPTAVDNAEGIDVPLKIIELTR